MGKWKSGWSPFTLVETGDQQGASSPSQNTWPCSSLTRQGKRVQAGCSPPSGEMEIKITCIVSSFTLQVSGFGVPAGQPQPVGVNGDQNIVFSLWISDTNETAAYHQWRLPGLVKFCFWGGHVPMPTPGPCSMAQKFLHQARVAWNWPGGRIFGWECSPITFGSITTLYFNPQILRESKLIYTTVESGGLLGDNGAPSQRHMGPFILYSIKAYKAQLAISDSCSMLQEQEEYQLCQVRYFPHNWKRIEEFVHRKLFSVFPNLPITSNLERIYWVGKISQFQVGTGTKPNQPLLHFRGTMKMNVLGHHYFVRSLHETSQIKFKPALLSLSLDWTRWGSCYLGMMDLWLLCKKCQIVHFFVC